jgi:D-apiose dehydrogenase
MIEQPRAGEPLRVGLAGAGWVAPYHLGAWASLAGRAEVIAIADPDLDAARNRARAFGIPAVHASVEAMLAREQLDAIDVAAPRDVHVEICLMAARRNLAILCQKPLAPMLADAEAIVEEVERLGARLMVHENWRFRPHYRRIREWLRADRIGQVRTVNVALLTSGLLPDSQGNLPALVRQPMLATLDRFLLMEVMIHLVDAVRFLLGPLTFAGACLGKSCPAVRGEDRASLLLRSADGASVSLVGDFMAHGHPPEQFDGVEILGTRGSITLERDRLRLRGERDEEVRLDLPSNYRASYIGAITHFVDRLSDGRPFETSPSDNLETLRIIETAYEKGAWPQNPA